MTNLKTSLVLAACLTLGAAGLTGLSRAHAADMTPTTKPSADTTPVNKNCPVSGDAIDPKITAVYNGKTYAFCCADCVKSFNKDPEKFAAKAK